MTHSCSVGNQPHMELAKSGDNTMQFALSKKAPNLVSLKKVHMPAHGITIEGKYSITQTWTLHDEGMKVNEVVVQLTREM